MPRPAFRAIKACEICLSLVPPRLMVVRSAGEVEHLAPSGTRARLREGMATGAVSPNKGGATSPNKSGGPASLRSQFGTPYIFD